MLFQHDSTGKNIFHETILPLSRVSNIPHLGNNAAFEAAEGGWVMYFERLDGNKLRVRLTAEDLEEFLVTYDGDGLCRFRHPP